MLVLDRNRALESMLWLSQRARNAVPAVLQRPAAPLAATVAPDGRRVLAAEVCLRPATSAAAATDAGERRPEPIAA